MAKGDILNDGSVEGESFTKNNECPFPESIGDYETFGEYKERVDKLVKEHDFHLGDLGWGAWHDYCRGNYDPSSKPGDTDWQQEEYDREQAALDEDDW